MLADAPSAIVLTGRGVEQQRNGTDAANAFINLALALGLPGRPTSGYGTLTGQGNGPRRSRARSKIPINCRAIRASTIRRRWRGLRVSGGVEPRRIARRGLTAADIFEQLGASITGLFVMASNPVVSAPRAVALRRRLTLMEHVVVCDFFPSETSAFAHVILPTLQWAEEGGTMTNLEGRVFAARAGRRSTARTAFRSVDPQRTRTAARNARVAAELRTARRL